MDRSTSTEEGKGHGEHLIIVIPDAPLGAGPGISETCGLPLDYGSFARLLAAPD